MFLGCSGSNRLIFRPRKLNLTFNIFKQQLHYNVCLPIILTLIVSLIQDPAMKFFMGETFQRTFYAHEWPRCMNY